jgi:hypothetical protein
VCQSCADRNPHAGRGNVNMHSPGVHQARLGCVPATSYLGFSPILDVRDSDMVSLLHFEQQGRRKMDHGQSRRDAAVDAGMDYWT